MRLLLGLLTRSATLIVIFMGETGDAAYRRMGAEEHSAWDALVTWLDSRDSLRK
ncbi:MAG: hypothetical protein JWO70_1832 [Betaproteobacteria bacterium]|nr:hypothetical protein [Betaproteobacteria bacterium]